MPVTPHPLSSKEDRKHIATRQGCSEAGGELEARTNAMLKRNHNMSRKEPSFAERVQTAVKAKQAQLEKMRAMALANDAQSAQRRAARVETAEARKVRTVEHKNANRVTAELRDAQREVEKARRAVAVTEEKARKDAERVAQVKADAALKQGQKAARDSKYAARKARQK